MDVLLFQVAVVVRHARVQAETGALTAVAVDDRAAIGVVVGWTSVARAGANLGELAAAVVEELVVNRS